MSWGSNLFHSSLQSFMEELSSVTAPAADQQHRQLKQVPVVDVNRDSLTQIWPSMIFSLSTATYVAMDVEFSGLGNRRSLMAKCVENRYAEISKTAKSRSVLSLGISCFRASPAPASRCSGHATDADQDTTSVVTNYNVQTFNLLLLCSKDYVVETASLQFLVDHGFDFNKQYSKGILYLPGDFEETGNEKETKPTMRSLFSTLIRSEKPLVIHNGLIDLAFLYQHFYAELPSKLATFVADIHEMFPAGLYDTKYIAEFHLQHTASYLEYVFRKLQISNEAIDVACPSNVRINFPKYGAEFDCVDYRDLSLAQIVALNKADVCLQYANHGWCPNGIKCNLSHNVCAILKLKLSNKAAKQMAAPDRARKRRARKRKKRSDKEEETKTGSANKDATEKLPDHNNKDDDDDDDDDDDNNDDAGGKVMEVTCQPESNADAAEVKTDLRTSDQSGTNDKSSSSHRAGYDAFMTGYAMAVFLASRNKSRSKSDIDLDDPVAVLSDRDFNVDVANRICLCGKNQPLLIQRSSFAPTSAKHRKNMIEINKKP